MWQGQLAEDHLWLSRYLFSTNDRYMRLARTRLSLPLLTDTSGSLVTDHAVCRQLGDAYGQSAPQPFDTSNRYFVVARMGAYYVAHMVGDTTGDGRRSAVVFSDSLTFLDTFSN